MSFRNVKKEGAENYKGLNDEVTRTEGGWKEITLI
jgi:hypothetical protein